MSKSLSFAHPWQSSIDEALRARLLATAEAMGMPLDITSGYRSPEYNRKVGGAKQSYHTHRKAVDINLSGLNEQQRAQLVENLRRQGLTGFGLYSKRPNMLHVDMRPKAHFMYDKSARHMSRAPDWFRNVASAPSAAPADMSKATNVGKLLRNPLTSGIARRRMAKSGIDAGITPEGRVRISTGMDGKLGNLARALSNMTVAPDVPQPAAPPAPSMLANTPPPAVPSAPSPIAQVGGLMGGLAQATPQPEPVDTSLADAAYQQRLAWAYANGFGQGLL